MSSMSSLPRRGRSAALRVVVFYALLFGAVCVGGLAALYMVVAAYTEQAIDMSLQSRAIALYPAILRGDDAGAQSLFSVSAAAHGYPACFYRLLSPTGAVLAHSDMSSWLRLPMETAGFAEANETPPVLQTVRLPGGTPVRQARVLSMRVQNERILQLGVSLDDRDRLLALFRSMAAIVGLVVLTVGIVTGRRIVTQAMSGVRRVTRAAERMADSQFAERILVPGAGAEVDQLARAFNGMADRIMRLMAEMRQGNDNIAHDLRSPITRIRGLAEMAITARRGSVHDPAESIGSIVEECDRMLNLINTMLDISEAEVGIGRSNLDEFDLATLVLQAAELFQVVAEDKGITLRTEVSGNVPVRGDRRKIQRLLSNLLDNALKYTERGEVRIALTDGKDRIRLSVRDTGVGIAEHEVGRIFERFYRCDSSRNQPGNGLGLSLARAIARAHGGDITVASRPGQGSEFTVILPKGAAPAAVGRPSSGPAGAG